MFRFGALNDAGKKSEEGEDGLQSKAPSQRVQEEEISKRYGEALMEQRKGNLTEAVEIYKELLDTPFLQKAERLESSQTLQPNGLSPIYGKTDLSIKYSCYKNLAEIHRSRKLLTEALEYYNKALDLDGTDVTMWYNAGIVGSKLGLIHFAPHAFLRGVGCSRQNLPCLDRAAISLYIEGDFTMAMEVLGHCFKINENYPRGLVLRDIMLESQPWLKKDMNLFCPGIDLKFDCAFQGPGEIKTKLLTEIETLRSNYMLHKKRLAEKPIEYVELKEPLERLTWEALGDGLLLLRKWFVDEQESASLRRVHLTKSLPGPKDDNPSENVNGNSEEPMDVSQEEAPPEVPHDGSASERETDDKKNKRRSGSSLMEELLWSGKRRSARVRTTRKGQEPMSVADTLTNILPRKLLHKMKPPRVEAKIVDDNSMDTMDLYRLFEKQDAAENSNHAQEIETPEDKLDRGKMVSDEGYFNTIQEESDVKNFLETEDKLPFNQIIKNYVLTLEKMWTKTWPKKLLAIFLESYKVMRSYFPLHPQFLNNNEIRNFVLEECGATLLYHEIMIDTSESCGEKVLPLVDAQSLWEISGYPSEFPDLLSHGIFELRMLWMRAHLFLGRGETSEAISFLYYALDCYTRAELEGKRILLKNCRRNNQITKDIVQAALDAQARKKSLAEVVRLFEEGCYKEVADILREYFNAPYQHSGANGGQESDIVDKATQLSMLIDSLYQLDQYKDCVYWLEMYCFELLDRSRGRGKNSEGSHWEDEFDRVLVALEECCELGGFKITDALEHPRLSRLVQTLCHAICKQTDDSQRPPCASRPWIMLNRILVALEESETYEKGKTDKEENDSDVDDEEDEPDIPASVMVLFTAHEYLGRREWCNCDGNVLLFLIMDQVIPRIRDPEWSSFRETIQQYLDQAVFCLYGHPNKKTKSRALTDHYVSPIALTWDRAIQLFQLYRPDETPSFDSLRVNQISSESEALFKRITTLIPDEINPAPGTEAITDYIFEKTDQVPKSLVKLPEPIQDLFYILGDYYVKTRENEKALTYLMTDLCANVDRVDSWASIALSKSSLLECTLNSCDPIENEDFLKEAVAVIRCFEHCLRLDSTICTLWIEYGSFAYTIHSFCSQRMKLESDILSLEQFEEIETTKTKMLETAKEAFMNANNIWSKTDEEDRQDERWLHHYMLGKICEKYGDLSYLEHYEKASQLLYENNAQYPKKISYNAPQVYAIEALEIYYRVHVCAIKCLELHDGEPLDDKTRTSFTKFLDIFSTSPFVKQLSKTDLLKQKAKEAEEIENAKQREQNTIKKVLNEVISKVEAEELAAKTRTIEMMQEILDDIISDAVVHASLKEPIQPVKSAVPKDGSFDEPETNMDVDVVKKELENNVEKPNDPEIIVLDSDSEQVTDKTDAKSVDENFGEIPKDDSDLIDEIKSKAEYCAFGFASGANIPPNVPIDVANFPPQISTFEPYPHEQLMDDNYYLTLDDLKNMKKSTKRKKHTKAAIVSSASSESGDIAYADESSSSSLSPASSRSRTSSGTESVEEEPPKPRKKGPRPTRPPKDEPDKEVKKSEIVETKPDEVEVEREKPAVAQANPPEIEVDPDSDMLKRCLTAFEMCSIRFPQHYKSVYRLAHFYYRSKKHKDLEKCRELLLGQFPSIFGNICGLFSERKTTNFFNGIWRLPASDVDRPGSFASHMSRSVLLLLEVLRDLKDHKLLLELCLQLRKVPEPDKRYLREDERNQLARQALTLSIQTLRHIARHSEVMTLPIVLDAYRIYRKVQKHYPAKESVYADCLLDAFNRLGKGKCSLDHCLKFCQAEIVANKVLSSPNAGQASVAKPKKLKKELKDGLQKTRLSKQIANKDTIPTAVTPETPKDGQDAVKHKQKSQTRKELNFNEPAAQGVDEPKPHTVNVSSETSARTRPELAALISSEKDARKKELPDTSQRKTVQEKTVKPSKEHKRTSSAPVLPSLDLSSALATLMKTATSSSSSFPNLPFMPPAGFPPMFPQQLMGFPMDSRNDMYFNQYTNFMSSYLTMLQGQMAPEKTPKHRKPRFSAPPTVSSSSTTKSPNPLQHPKPTPIPSQSAYNPQAAKPAPTSSQTAYTNPQPSKSAPTSSQTAYNPQPSKSAPITSTYNPQPVKQTPTLNQSAHIPQPTKQTPTLNQSAHIPQPTKPSHSPKQHSLPSHSPKQPSLQPHSPKQQFLPKPQLLSKPTYNKPPNYPKLPPIADPSIVQRTQPKPSSPSTPKQPTPSRPKFNIEDILCQKSDSSQITKASSGQTEAMNLSAKPKTPVGKRNCDEQIGNTPKKPCPEIVIIDD